MAEGDKKSPRDADSDEEVSGEVSSAAGADDSDKVPAPRAKAVSASDAEDGDDDGDEADGEAADADPPPRRTKKVKAAGKPKARKAKRAVIVDDDPDDEAEADDEDDEDEHVSDEDDEDDEDEEAARREAARRRKRLKRRKARARAKLLPVPTTEAELDTPDRSTNYMIWAVVAATFLLWGFARTACNFNPPQTDKPKLAELDIIAREPKGSAVEFELKLRERHFEIAQKLALPEVLPEVERAKQACGASCAPLERRVVLCQGALLERTATDAKVRVGCEQGGKSDYQLLSLRREQTEWKVSARQPTSAPPPVGATAATATALPTIPPPAPPGSAGEPPKAAP